MSVPRIYLYYKSFPPRAEAFRGGMDKAIHGLAQGLAQNGADVTLLCENEADGGTQTPFGYTVRCFRWVGKGPMSKLSPGLVKFLPETRGGLVILNAVFHPSVCAVAKRLQALGVPYVVAPHDPYHPSIFAKNPWIKWPYWFLRERPMLRHAAGVQVLDARHGQYLKDLRVLTHVLVGPNGYDETEVPDEKTLSFNESGPARLAFLGRFDTSNKGLDLLIDAFSGLDGSIPVTLTLQGPAGGDRAALQQRAAKLGLGDRVEFKPPDFTRSASSLLSQYDVLCLPSRFEGFSMAALEAILAARVVLVSDVAGISPFVREWDCGQVVTPTVTDVRNGMLKLLERREQWKVMGRSGRSSALVRLRWNRIAAELLPEYERLIKV